VSGPARWSASGPSEPVPDGRSHGRAQSDPGIEAPPGFEPPPRPVPAVRPGTGRSLPWTILRRLLLELKQLMLPKSSGRERVWALRVRPALLRAAGVPPAPMPLARVVVESGPAERHFGPGDPVRSILLLKVDHIGDLLLALPAFATLRRGFPDASITLMCGPWNVAVARRLALFDRVVAVSFFPGKADASRRRTFDPGGIAALGLPEFDLAVDLRVDEDSRLLLRHVRARFKAGYFSRLMPPDMALVLPQDSPAAPGPPDMLHHQRGLMGRLAGAVVATLDPLQDGEAMLARVTAEHDAAMAAELAGLARPVVAVNTMSGRDIKNWPLDRFVAVCRWITAELGGTVVLLGGPGDARNAAAILREVGAGGRDAGAGRLGAGLGEAGAGPRGGRGRPPPPPPHGGGARLRGPARARPVLRDAAPCGSLPRQRFRADPRGGDVAGADGGGVLGHRSDRRLDAARPRGHRDPRGGGVLALPPDPHHGLPQPARLHPGHPGGDGEGGDPARPGRGVRAFQGAGLRPAPAWRGSQPGRLTGRHEALIPTALECDRSGRQG